MSRTRSPRERPEAGSSSISTVGSAASAIASATCRCSPWEREPTVSPSFRVDGDLAGGEASALADLPLPPRQQHRPEAAALDADDREVDAVLDGETEELPGLLVGAREAELDARAGGLAR